MQTSSVVSLGRTKAAPFRFGTCFSEPCPLSERRTGPVGVNPRRHPSAHLSTPRLYAVTTPPLPVNGQGHALAMLGAVNLNFTSPSREVRRTTRLSLTLRVPCGRRSVLGQIVASLQRRLALAQHDAKPAKENQCN